MEFECKNKACKEIFHPHRFIGFRHPGNARCPKCGAKGKLTEFGKEMRRSRFTEMNKATFGKNQRCKT